MPSTVTLVTSSGGTATVIDQSDVAIAALTTALTAQNVILVQISNVLANAANTLVDVQGEINGIGESLQSVKETLDAMATTAATANAINAMKVSNEIKKTNFDMAAAKESLARSGLPEPTVPSTSEQMKTSLKESFVLMKEGQTAAFVSNQFTHLINNVINWLKNHLPTVYIQNAIDWAKRKVTALIRPSATLNPQSISVKLANTTKTQYLA